MNFCTPRFLRLFLLPLLLLAGEASRAQITSGNMAGAITDTGRVGVVAATLRAIHTPTGTAYSTQTTTDGTFSIQNMRIGGPYSVTISSEGYETQMVDTIFITLGETFRLNVTLGEVGRETAINEVVVRGGRNPILNSQRTGATTNVSEQQLNTLPTIGRSITDFTRLTPQGGPSFTTSGGLNNANTFGGRDGRYNNVQINGANVNNAFGLSSDLLPGGGAQPISLDAIEELQIGIAPFDVRQSNFTGANVNAVTRSGTNTYTGSAYTFWRNQTFNGTHVGDRDLPDAQASTNNIYGVRFGGPIIKNKLFFFVNGEYEKRVFPGVTWVANGAGASGNVSRTSADSLKLVRDYLINKYGYDPGEYQNYANNFSNANTKFLARIDYNISDKHKLFVSYNQLNATSDETVNNTSAAGNPTNVTNNRIGPQSIAFQKSNYGFDNTVRIVSAELASQFSRRISNQFLATYTQIRTTRTSDSEPFPFVDIVTSRAAPADNQMSFGYELFSFNNDLKNNTLSFFDNLTYTRGMHEITAGAQFDYITFGNSFQRFGTGYYRYASVQDFINDRAPLAFAYTYPYGSDAFVSLNFGQAGLYVQDRISLTKRLTVTPGLRVDLPFYFNDLPNNQRLDTLNIPTSEGAAAARQTYATSEWPKQRLLYSPRLSFNWDALGNHALQVRGGTGIFSGRLPFVWFTNQAGGIGTLINSVTITDAATLNQIKFNADPKAIAAQFPGRFPTTGDTTIPGEIAFVNSDFKFPQVWRSNLAADFRLPFFGLIGTVEGIFTRDVNNVRQVNLNLADPTAQLNNYGDTRPLYATGTGNRVFSGVSGIYMLENTTNGYSYSGTIGITKPARRGLYGSLFYTGTYAEEISSNPGSQAGSAWNGLPHIGSANEAVLRTSQYLTPHRVVGTVSYRIEYLKHAATTVSVLYDGASPGRFSWLYASDINRDGANNDLIWVPNRAEDLQWADVTTGTGANQQVVYTKQQQIDAFNQLLDGDEYLDSRRNNYAERYGGKYPFYHRFDVRLLQDVFTNLGKRRGTLQFSVDVLNASNLLNRDWGTQNALSVGSGNRAPLLRVQSYAGGNQPIYQLATGLNDAGEVVLPTETFRDDYSVNSTWGVQLGLRLTY